jgi:membrane peptidoglycan carboxypeptidase
VRENVVLDYLNTVPLSARVGHGEINGIGDALYVWYGEDFSEFNAALQQMNPRAPRHVKRRLTSVRCH